MIDNQKFAFLRFKLNWRKAIEGIDVVARTMPGVSQYYIGKAFYFADKEHFLDWGRPISGDRYIAMEHGPVPSSIYDFLKDDSGEPDEIADELDRRLTLKRTGNKICVFSRNASASASVDDGVERMVPDFPNLSPSDVKYLEAAILKYGKMEFGQLKALSHREPAYVEAEQQFGLNNEMNLARWIEELPQDSSTMLEQLVSANARIKFYAA